MGFHSSYFIFFKGKALLSVLESRSPLCDRLLCTPWWEESLRQAELANHSGPLCFPCVCPQFKTCGCLPAGQIIFISTIWHSTGNLFHSPEWDVHLVMPVARSVNTSLRIIAGWKVLCGCWFPILLSENSGFCIGQIHVLSMVDLLHCPENHILWEQKHFTQYCHSARFRLCWQVFARHFITKSSTVVLTYK